MPARRIASSVALYLATFAILSLPTGSPRNFARGQTQAVDEQLQDSSERSPPETYMGRTIAPFMDASGAEWLTRRSREQEEQPTKLLAALPVKESDVVCDFGCGNGFYTLELAKRVGPRGKVYAVDIQQAMLDKLVERMGARSLENVVPVLATAADPKLPVDVFHLVLMVDVYHELSHPAEVLAQVRASLRKDGRLTLVEFREEDPDVPIKPLHKMSQVQVMKEISANGFKLVGQFDGLPWQHVLFFGRDDSSTATHELQPWKRLVAPAEPESDPPGRSDPDF